MCLRVMNVRGPSQPFTLTLGLALHLGSDLSLCLRHGLLLPFHLQSYPLPSKPSCLQAQGQGGSGLPEHSHCLGVYPNG